MEFLISYALFFAKAATVLLAILIVIAALCSLPRRAKFDARIEITDLNKEFEEMEQTLPIIQYSKA